MCNCSNCGNCHFCEGGVCTNPESSKIVFEQDTYNGVFVSNVSDINAVPHVVEDCELWQPKIEL